MPDDEYETKDFEKIVSLRARTEAISLHLTDFLKREGRFGKTIVFCVDQEHATEMRKALTNLNADLVRQHPDYVVRVTADEGEIGRGHLSRFQELETQTPTILTTSQLLTTGVDVPTCQNVVIARVIGSMVEFKQIIGRGTRVRDDYGKLYFNILDYTGSATRLFADPDFDGDPVIVLEEITDENGRTTTRVLREEPIASYDDTLDGAPSLGDDAEGERRKIYFDWGSVEIIAHLVYEIDPNGKQLRVVKYTDYTADNVRTMYPSAAGLRSLWADPEQRKLIIASLEDRGISLDHLAESAGHPEADPFDMLCHVAFSAPLRTRRERANRLRLEQPEFFDRYGPDARTVLGELLEKYAEYGAAQFTLPDVLKLPPISERGNVLQIAELFGGGRQLRDAVNELQTLLYAA